MLEIKLETGHNSCVIFTSSGSVSTVELWENLEEKGFSRSNFYLLQNGKVANNVKNQLEGCATLIPKLLGGKGGFGSMLRAIGAQIEKTTNREACRDLSGRRLRDINEEKRLKAWIEKQASRKEEEVERKKRKLERLCAEPKHEFKDKNYDHERSILTERIDDAVEQGFKTAAASCSEEKKVEEKKGIKRKTLLDDFDEDIDSDELSSSDDESNESPMKVLKSAATNFGDSGCSSGVEEQSESSRDKNSPEMDEQISEDGEKFKADDETAKNEDLNGENEEKNCQIEEVCHADASGESDNAEEISKSSEMKN